MYVLTKIVFWQILAWKEYNFLSGFLTNTILNFCQEFCFLHHLLLFSPLYNLIHLSLFFTYHQLEHINWTKLAWILYTGVCYFYYTYLHQYIYAAAWKNNFMNEIWCANPFCSEWDACAARGNRPRPDFVPVHQELIVRTEPGGTSYVLQRIFRCSAKKGATSRGSLSRFG